MCIRLALNRSAATVFLAIALARVAAAFQIGSQPAAQWIPHLEDPKRVATLYINEVIRTVGLKPGMVIADIGSGSGVFTRPFAKAVASDAGGGGKAIAVDIDPALLSYVAESAAKQGIKNIETHLAPIDDPQLSGPILDVAFFHEVFHHIEHRELYIRNLAKYMKPGGRIVLIEPAAHADMSAMHSGGGSDGSSAGGSDSDAAEHDMHQALHGNHQTMMHHGEQVAMSTERENADAILAAAGFKPVQESNLFGSNKFFVIYAKQ
jgi:ubiquinone/menaquinone biosynthesis C-methylase UbiE